MSIDVTQSTKVPTGTWTIDPSHSEVGFTVRHLMTKVRGQFEKFEGTDFRTDGLNPFVPGVTSIWLGSDARDYTAQYVTLSLSYRFD